MVVPGAALLMSTRQDVPKQAHATAWRRCEPGRPAAVDEEMQGLLSHGAPGNPQHCTDRRIGSLNAQTRDSGRRRLQPTVRSFPPGP